MLMLKKWRLLIGGLVRGGWAPPRWPGVAIEPQGIS